MTTRNKKISLNGPQEVLFKEQHTFISIKYTQNVHVNEH